MPTGVPVAAPSATVFAAPFASVGTVGATSPTAMEKLCELLSAPAVAWTVKVYCRNHESRFGGRVYCVACQRAFPPA